MDTSWARAEVVIQGALHASACHGCQSLLCSFAVCHLAEVDYLIRHKIVGLVVNAPLRDAVDVGQVCLRRISLRAGKGRHGLQLPSQW